MKTQTPAESVRYDEDDWHDSVMGLDPALNNGSSKNGNIAQQMAILLEMVPELFGHREADL